MQVELRAVTRAETVVAWAEEAARVAAVGAAAKRSPCVRAALEAA